MFTPANPGLVLAGLLYYMDLLTLYLQERRRNKKDKYKLSEVLTMYRRYKRKRTLKTIIIILFICTISLFFSLRRIRSGGEKQFNDANGKRNWSKPQIVCDSKKIKRRLTQFWNLTDLKPPNFLSNFKNPCFYANITLHSFPPLRTTQQVRCLPYFMIAGFPKSGTTDLWFRLMNHPDVVISHAKEPNFFNKGLLGDNDLHHAVEQYMETFTRTTYGLQRLVSPALCQGTFPYHHGITGEGSVDTAFDSSNWRDIPGNEYCPEPRITIADYVHRLLPNLKVIFLVRNPVDRLYSDYIYEARFLQYNISRRDFHRTVLDTIQKHKDCQAKFSIRTCAYNGTIDPFKVRLRIGMYSIFIKDWMDVFPRQQILVIKTEDLKTSNLSRIYQQLFKFLDIRPFTKAEEVRVLNKALQVNSRSYPEKQLGDMLNDTRSILKDFYKPHNWNLAKLLENHHFLWDT